MDTILRLIKDYTGLSIETQEKIFVSIIIIFIIWLIRLITLKLIWKNTEDAQYRYRWQKWMTYIAVSLGILLVGRIWFVGFQSLATYLGLVTAGLAIALKDLVASVAGWVFILWRKPFEVGDRLQIGDYRGDVIDIRIFKFTILEIGNWVDADQSTGRVMHLPNSLVLSEGLINYAQGFRFIWHEIAVLITFESDWKKAKTILKKIAEKHAAHISSDAEKRMKEASKKYFIHYTALTPTVYTTVRDSGVLLTIRYLIGPRGRRDSEQQIWEEVLETFAQHKNIDFAYPTQRFYDNLNESKEAKHKPSSSINNF